MQRDHCQQKCQDFPLHLKCLSVTLALTLPAPASCWPAPAAGQDICGHVPTLLSQFVHIHGTVGGHAAGGHVFQRMAGRWQQAHGGEEAGARLEMPCTAPLTSPWPCFEHCYHSNLYVPAPGHPLTEGLLSSRLGKGFCPDCKHGLECPAEGILLLLGHLQSWTECHQTWTCCVLGPAPQPQAQHTWFIPPTSSQVKKLPCRSLPGKTALRSKFVKVVNDNPVTKSYTESVFLIFCLDSFINRIAWTFPCF